MLVHFLEACLSKSHQELIESQFLIHLQIILISSKWKMTKLFGLLTRDREWFLLSQIDYKSVNFVHVVVQY